MYLVTGGCGFIGSHIAELLVKNGEKVRVLDNLSSGSLENISAFRKDVEFIEGDIRDRELLRRITAGVEGIFHEAALVSVPESMKQPALNHEINVTGTFNILDCAAAAGVRKVVLASSAAVYGNLPELPKREKMDTLPDSPYGFSKLAGEGYGDLYRRLYPMDVTALRYFNVFGPRQDPSSMYSGVLSIFTEAFMKNQCMISIFGDGKQTRDFIYVKDVAEANVMNMGVKGSGCYNTATGRSSSLLDVVGALENITGKQANITYRETREGDIRYSEADISAIKRLGFLPKYDLEKGLKEYLRHMTGGCDE